MVCPLTGCALSNVIATRAPPVCIGEGLLVLGSSCDQRSRKYLSKKLGKNSYELLRAMLLVGGLAPIDVTSTVVRKF